MGELDETLARLVERFEMIGGGCSHFNTMYVFLVVIRNIIVDWIIAIEGVVVACLLRVERSFIDEGLDVTSKLGSGFNLNSDVVVNKDLSFFDVRRTSRLLL